jgi:hypothetical protein
MEILDQKTKRCVMVNEMSYLIRLADVNVTCNRTGVSTEYEG